MTIAFRQGAVLTVIGPGGVLHALCSTIAVKLESGAWGSRFPLILNALYQGELAPQHAREAMQEAHIIKRELAALAPSEVVWDIERPGAAPPWGNAVGAHICNMAQYFITTTGRNLVDEIIDNLESQIEFGGPLQIVPFDAKH